MKKMKKMTKEHHIAWKKLFHTMNRLNDAEMKHQEIVKACAAAETGQVLAVAEKWNLGESARQLVKLQKDWEKVKKNLSRFPT